MILGLGSDICDIRRIEAALARHGDRFMQRVFTPTEIEYAMRRTPRTRAATFAKRFAAKEAFSKALGTGFTLGVFLSNVGVMNLPSGQPTMDLTGGAAERLAGMVPPDHRPRVFVSMSDEHPYAFAQVIISAEPVR